MSIYNSFTRKQILNQRYVRSVARQYGNELRALYERVAAQAARQPNNTRLQAVYRDLQQVINVQLNELGQEIRNNLNDFAADELAFVDKVMQFNTSIVLQAPDITTIERALASGDMLLLSRGDSLTLDEAINAFLTNQEQTIKQIINDGILQGKTIDEITNALRTLGPNIARHRAEALARTLTNYTTSQVRKQFAIENAEAFDAEEWSAVLDVRTTLICGGRDGNIYPIGKGPYPPAHYNCRSQRIPILLDDFVEGEQKSRNQEFDSWLRKQSAAFQDDYFKQFPDGDKKADLFRNGGLEIQFFRDERGVEYDLEQLKALHPIAYSKAGINDSP